jgi:hypothetical protein
VFNEAGANVDFRVEGDTNANLLFVDASADNVGIGTSSPTQKLSIQGADFESSSFNGQTIGDFNAERIRVGYKNGTPDAGLVPAQIISDTSLFQFASRDIASGAITFATGTGIPERMRISSTGNVGIGTSSPNAKLEVNGHTKVSSVEATTAVIAGGAIPFHANYASADGVAPALRLGSPSNTTMGFWDFQPIGTNQADLAIERNDVERLRITSAGNVGIGTSSPSARLDVSGASGSITVAPPGSGSSGTIYSTENGMVIGTPSSATNKVFIVHTDGTERLRITSTGNVGIGTTSPDANLTVSGAASFAAGTALLPSIARAGDLNTGIFFPAADTIAASTAGSERLRITSTGNVGIGTSSPTSILSLGGDTNTDRFIHISGIRSVIGYDTTLGVAGALLLKGGNKEIFIDTGGPKNILLFTDNTERLRITDAGNVGIGTTSPNASAILDVQSTTKGVRMPNMTTTQKNAIASPAAGLMVYDTTLAKLCVYTTAWETITSL